MDDESLQKLFSLLGLLLNVFDMNITSPLSFTDTLYMRRTCSARMSHFKIMMIDGVCRSERTGNGYLCMCGKHLCNSARQFQPYNCIYFAVFSVILYFKQLSPTWTS